jgi:hypothetical protein
MSTFVWDSGSTNFIRLRALTDQRPVNPTIVANAVVTTSVLDLDDLPVAGVPDPLTMAAVGGDRLDCE